MLRRRHIAWALLACSAAMMFAVPAAAKTYKVSGRQIAVDADNGIFKMRGRLIGSWKVTAFQPLATSPLFHAQGTELFDGCLNRGRDHSCKGDRKGTLTFSFDYWALFASADPSSLVWGACVHPVVSGTRAFAGAQGVITMIDTPTARGVSTRYDGNLVLSHGRQASSTRSLANASSTCGAR
jgi:hypothetical protein